MLSVTCVVLCRHPKHFLSFFLLETIVLYRMSVRMSSYSIDKMLNDLIFEAWFKE